MIPFLPTDTGPAPQNGVAITPDAATTAEGTAFADVFSLLAATTPAKTAEITLPTTASGDQELLIPQDDLITPAPTDTDVPVPDPTVEERDTPIDPILVASGSGPAAPPNKPVDKGDIIMMTRTPAPAPTGPAPSTDVEQPVATKPAIPDRAEPRQVTVSQTVLEGRLPQENATKPAIPAEKMTNGRLATPAAPVPTPEVTPVAQPGPMTNKKVQAAALPIDQAPVLPLPIQKDVEAPRRRIEPPPAEIRNTTTTGPASNISHWIGSNTTPAIAAPLFDLQSRGRAEIPTETASLLPLTERGASILQTPTASPITAGADTARHVAHQVAVAISAQPGQTTEIALSPKELGRVRLSIVAVDGAITLAVLAERPETADLMRRHIDVLAQEFKSLGYDDIAFSFADDSQTEPEDKSEKPGAKSATVDGGTVEDPPSHPKHTVQSGLDLRL
ncbi:flagellar hook-length control protein FliK [Yoonia sp. SDW83-1]|uniref:flagellar hook-length control protein FliK n=1 Tax=Yoonia sp. SDW83-1 TaxID=3366945 RepID=UPI00398C6414